ncbi:hypothetical protein [Cellulomonas sp. URHD0024]|uniref:hypothetical protein n=1 Tax=Cellulomonas sp. URHD0024 TaxID=1302620 RepID=UPI0012DC213B|nr:hypothetical protein [Cellulomonas sp. URHD0024]
MTTTFDDADLFSDVFTGFRGVGASTRHSRLLTALTLVAALLLVVGGLVWSSLARQTPAVDAIDPADLVPVLAESQRAGDVIASSDLADLLIYPESTRYLTSDDTTTYFVATAPDDKLCLLAMPVGDLAQTSCASTAGTPHVLRLENVMLVPAGATAPAGWHEAAANVFVRS